MNTCPDCKCQFVQPFKCITCGAEKLYDATVRGQALRIAVLESAVHKAYNTFENITVQRTLSDAQDQAHRFIGHYQALAESLYSQSDASAEQT